MKLGGYLALLLVLAACQEKKISSSNVLIPLIYDDASSRKIQFNVHAYNGCYQWASSQPTALRVESIKPNCEDDQATIRLQTNTLFNQIIWISAYDQKSNTLLKVEAIIGQIDRIEILTKQRTIDLDVIEELHLRGFDKDGNTFSTLEGIRFKWTVNDEKIQILQLKQTPLQSTEIRRELEEQHYQSDVIVVKGMKVGKTIISVSLREEGYNQIISHMVELSVLEKIAIMPNTQPLYFPTNSNYQFKLYLVKTNENILKEISLPNSTYTWMTDSSRSSITLNGVLTTKEVESSKYITIMNQYTVDNFISVEYHVVHPHSLGIRIIDILQEQPSVNEQYFKQSRMHTNITSLVVGRQYRLQGYLRDVNGNTIETNDQDIMEFTSISGLIRGNMISSDKLLNNVRIRVHHSIRQLTSELEVRFVNPIQLHTPYSYIHLPKGEIYALNITGGSTSYLVFNNQQVVNSQQIGSNYTGTSTITIYDQYNPYNRIITELYITEVQKIWSLEAKKELIVNEEDILYIIGNGRINTQLQNYTQCHSLSFNTETIQQQRTQSLQAMKQDLTKLYQSNNFIEMLLLRNPNVYQLQDTYGVCSGLQLLSKQPHRQESVIITYNAISTSLLIKTFNQTSSNIGNALFIAPYSQYQVDLYGGPTPWNLNTIIRLPDNSNYIFINENSFIYDCQIQHNQQMNEVLKQNPQSIDLPMPKLMRFPITIHCQLPASFRIMNQNQESLNWILRNEVIPLQCLGLTKDNQVFHNISSLVQEWSTKQPLVIKDIKLSVDGIGSQGIVQVVSKYYQNNRRLEHNVNGESIVKVYEMFSIQPAEELVLIGGYAEFQVQSGSGTLSCKHNNTPVECSNGVIRIHATVAGHSVVSVSDQILGKQATAKLIAADPDELVLTPKSQYTVEGEIAEVQLSVYYKRQQFKYVDAKLITLELSPKHSYTNVDEIFRIQTTQVEAIQVRAKMGSTLYSRSITLAIIGKISANPAVVYMPPECQTFVTLTNYEKLTYTATSKDVKVQMNGYHLEITSNTKVGDFIVVIQLSYGTQILQILNLPITVQKPTQVKLLYGENRQISEGAQVRVVSALYYKERLMNICYCAAIYEWSVKDTQHKAVNLFGITVSANTIGYTLVSLYVYGQHASTNLNVINPFDIERNIFIGVKQQWIGPLLIPNQSTLDLQVNQIDILCGQNVLKVDGKQLRATSGSEQALVKFFRKDDQLLTAVEVQQIYQLYPMEQMVILKHNEQISINLMLLNRDGRVFEKILESKVVVQQIYNPLLLSVSLNQQIMTIKGHQQGWSIIQLSLLDDPKAVDYILVQVGVFITPNEISAYIGSSIQFNMVNNPQGTWSSNCGTFSGSTLILTKEGRCDIIFDEAGQRHEGFINSVRPHKIRYDRVDQAGDLGLQFKFWPDVTAHENVDTNLKVVCTVSSDWFRVETLGDKCIIKPQVFNGKGMTKEVQVMVTLSNGAFIIKETIIESFDRDIIIQQKDVTLTSGYPTDTIRIPFYEDVPIIVDDSILRYVNKEQYNVATREIVINVDFTTLDASKDTIEGRIWLMQGKLKQESQSIKIVYTQQHSIWTYMATQDIILVFCAIALIFIMLYNYQTSYAVLQ